MCAVRKKARAKRSAILRPSPSPFWQPARVMASESDPGFKKPSAFVPAFDKHHGDCSRLTERWEKTTTKPAMKKSASCTSLQQSFCWKNTMPNGDVPFNTIEARLKREPDVTIPHAGRDEDKKVCWPRAPRLC